MIDSLNWKVISNRKMKTVRFLVVFGLMAGFVTANTIQAQECRPATTLSLANVVQMPIRAYRTTDGRIQLVFQLQSPHDLRTNACPDDPDTVGLRWSTSSNVGAWYGTINYPWISTLFTAHGDMILSPSNPTQNMVVAFQVRYSENWQSGTYQGPRRRKGNTTVPTAAILASTPGEEFTLITYEEPD
jgi:hypothetical protein